MADETVVIPTETSKDSAGGAFNASLVRNNKQIRSDRAIAITEDAQLLYKRQVEDLETKIKRMRRERENMLDLSPGDKNSLMLATDFDGSAFAAKDLELAVNIRNEEIKLGLAQERYNHLFGE